jgi:cytochrome c peroxidase
MRALTLMMISALTLAACGGHAGGGGGVSAAPAAKFRATPPLSLMAQVGQKIFFDKRLSGSGKMSCATCHDPNYAHGPPNDLAVQLGGSDLTTPGLRAVPSLRYKEYTPAYADLLDNPDGISVPGPGGGFTWDGRVNTLAEQAGVPLLSSFEMANASAADVVAKLQAGNYAKLFRQAFGDDAFSNVATAFKDAAAALQAYQLEDSSFHPYSSKFDLYAGNKIGGALTPAEARGLAVFSNPKIGNCSSCHYQGAGLNGSSALFTDFSYEAIGAPRNVHVRANLDPAHVDMGVCGPLRSDHTPASPAAPEVHCGMFGAPTLRNVATRKVFFHNGVIHSLEQAIRFYNTRDTNPEIWYPTVGGTPKAGADPAFPKYGLVTTQYEGGTVQKFDDLPAGYRSNIDVQMPLDGRPAGSMPPMTEQNIVDLVCFLGTLTDGYEPPAAPPTSGPCIN